MSAWKTLADVPRDGRTVLLWGPHRPEPATWSWNEDESCWDAAHEQTPVRSVDAGDGVVAFKTALDIDFVLWSPVSYPD